MRIDGICQDVPDAEYAQAGALAHQKLECLGTLAGGIAHDVNNLLGAVLAQAELAQAGYAAGSSPVEQLEAIRNLAISGSEIVRQLMVYAGEETEDLGPVDVSRVVEQMLALLKVTVSKRAALVTDLGKGLPCARASAAQLRQIVMNLVINASEAIEDTGGLIRIATRHLTVDEAAAISEGDAEGDYLQLEVVDSGRGMPAEVRDRVFDPFFTTKSSGRGLGLSVVRAIVSSLGGAIQVSSEPGKGTAFWVLLPSAGIGTRAADNGAPRAEAMARPLPAPLRPAL